MPWLFYDGLSVALFVFAAALVFLACLVLSANSSFHKLLCLSLFLVFLLDHVRKDRSQFPGIAMKDFFGLFTRLR